MREIKFRAWHHGAGDPRVVGDMRCCNGNLKLFFESVDNEFLSVEIMQYTGLKDKNGVEIYEGDIVECPGYVGVIQFSNEEPRFEVLPIGERDGLALFFADGHLKVIGNIHQNPELLK